MKLKDVAVGKRYHAKVSDASQVVRVTEMKEIPPAAWSNGKAWRTLIHRGQRGDGPDGSPSARRSDSGHCQERLASSATSRITGLTAALVCPYCGKRLAHMA